MRTSPAPQSTNTMRTMRSYDDFTRDADDADTAIADPTATTTDDDDRRKRTKTTHAASRICYDWMIVLGNCHYARDRASFTHYRAMPRRTLVKNNIFNPHEELEVAGVGTVELRVCRTVRDGGASSHVLVLEDVLHIPEAVCNGFNPLLYGSSMSCNMEYWEGADRRGEPVWFAVPYAGGTRLVLAGNPKGASELIQGRSLCLIETLESSTGYIKRAHPLAYLLPLRGYDLWSSPAETMERLNSYDSPQGLYYPDDAHIRGISNAALAMATFQQKPRLWSKNMFKLYWAIAVATLNSCINGYDGSLMGSINSYRQYREYFGFDPEAGTPSTGIVYAIYTIGNIVGSFCAGPFTDFRGRRVGMALGAAFIILGTIVQATCTNLAGFMAGRFLLGFGVATSATAGPAYVSEIAHPSWRGSLTGLYNVLWFAGGIPGTFIPWRTSQIEGTMSWRIPIWVQMVFAGLVLVLCWTIPESPRWLVSRDKHEEAIRVLATYHGDGDRNAPLVQLEYREMVEDISNTGADKRWWDYRELFNSRETRYRSMLVILMAFFGQWSGNGPVSYYYPQMLAGAGITSNTTRLLLQGLQNVCQFVGAIFGALLTDRIGRRAQLLTSTALMVLLFSIITALNATNVDPPDDETGGVVVVAKSAVVARAQIAMIFIFGFVFSAGWTPNQAMYPVECLRYESRAKGMGMNNFFINVANFYNTFVTGIAFTRAGWRYYLLFIFWDVLELAVIWFLFVETSRRTLEELTAIFQSRNPVKASLARDEVLVPQVEQEVEMRRKDYDRRKVDLT
ncbi:hypothetical protein LV164_005221 [Aspergillus fumigatus]|nr:hypothetical protein KXV32_004522 [Aspergillus fumigatus]KAH3003438.1 hypothetical protein KXW60_006237 [Aspergillus fumigatus]KAH3183285.1 hypothetical protein KXV92_006977 [Aspergillus fumigatus]KAH3266071.1 hypothetical protein KXW55_006280 [Aspergillus fumigatus]KAH3520922.1 hypothetical protein KXV64_006347 [Aspergillus fumigatus]